MKRFRPYVITAALLGTAVPHPLVAVQPKTSSPSVVRVRVFEGPS